MVFVLFIINVCRECAFAYLDLSAEVWMNLRQAMLWLLSMKIMVIKFITFICLYFLQTTDPVLETVLQRIYMMMSTQQDSPRRKSTLVHTKLSSVAIKIIYSYWVVFSSVACSLSFMCLMLCHCVCS